MRYKTALSAFCLLLLLAVCPAVAIDKEVLAVVRAKLAKGEALLTKGKYAEAESLFRSAVAAEPLVPTAHLGLGAALVGEQRFEQALAVLEETERRFIEWEQMIGIAELQKRHIAESQLQLLKDLAGAQAAAMPPGTEIVSEQAGQGTISKEQFLFRERRDLEGLHAIPPQVFYLEGISYLRTDRPILGIEALEICLLINPDHGLANYNLAVALFGQGEIVEAREHLDAAVLAGIEPHKQFVADLAQAED